MFAFFLSRIFSMFSDQLISLAILTLWISARGFALTIDPDKGMLHGRQLNWSEVQKNYNDLKQFSKLLNNAIGTRVSLLLFRIAFFYSVSFGSVSDINGFVYLMIYACGACMKLFLASDICSQVLLKNLMTWAGLDFSRILLNLLVSGEIKQ